MVFDGFFKDFIVPMAMSVIVLCFLALLLGFDHTKQPVKINWIGKLLTVAVKVSFFCLGGMIIFWVWK